LKIDNQVQQFATGNQLLKTESLPNGVQISTLENGIKIYQIPKALMPKKDGVQNAPLGCNNNLPANADGCCCIDFLYFGNAVIPGIGTVTNTFIFNEQTYTLPNPAIRAFYLKIKTVDAGTIFYENILPWGDITPDCSGNVYRGIQFFDIPFCGGDLEVTAKKIFKENPSVPDFSTCAETVGTFYFTPYDSGAHCFF
jgi:hypothetical protein